MEHADNKYQLCSKYNSGFIKTKRLKFFTLFFPLIMILMIAVMYTKVQADDAEYDDEEEFDEDI